MQTTELATFLRAYVAVGDGDEATEYYLRLRSGAQRKTAETLASGLALAGKNEGEVARDVLRRVANAATGHPTWVEILRHGESTVADVMKLAPAEGAEADAPPAAIDAQGMVGALVGAITSSNATLAGRLSHLESLIDGKDQRLLQLAERAAMAETMLVVEQERQAMIEQLRNAGDAEMTHALALLEPVIKPVGILVAQAAQDALNRRKKPAKPEKKDDKPQTPDERADALLEVAGKLIDDATALVTAHPEIIAPRGASLLALAMRASTLQDQLSAAVGGA